MVESSCILGLGKPKSQMPRAGAGVRCVEIYFAAGILFRSQPKIINFFFGNSAA